ncbi:uncharacterized protein BCR38DRAFT_428555 [Pseudomassariella vexata]|uniref:DUF3074 domain-containing protein n=1 Tax=Pseudomassariella vexata TaxID=1141098 RepID=A0A1Y2E3B7_9PEZI|nr:uncharacterized protein BCR38DRAFT_428555 [Pseudomassariella vexata]ORY65854.1 hypothetical protein BCR38DRAFT_428555 [Pseudomassariella vexata]
MATPAGPLVRLWGIPTSQLPSSTATADELAPFLTAILQEAVPFIDSAAPKSSPAEAQRSKVWKPKGVKSSSDSTAKVEVSERTVPAAELEAVATPTTKGKGKLAPEMWACRRSVHQDAAERGTASWAEFEHSFRFEHAKSEDAFTPNVLATHEALVWDCGGVSPFDLGGETWGEFSLKVEEMRHKVGRPVLKDRTFPVLQMVATTQGKQEFVVVSIPVPDFGTESEASRLAREKGAQVARYVSVELIRKMADGKIEWLMATASDAGGVLPMWVQNKAMPGVVWKDVPLFLRWIAKERGDGGTRKESGASKGSIVPEVSTGTARDAGNGATAGASQTATAPEGSGRDVDYWHGGHAEAVLGDGAKQNGATTTADQ